MLGVVSLKIAANPNVETRTGTVLVTGEGGRGQTLVVITQEGATPPEPEPDREPPEDPGTDSNLSEPGPEPNPGPEPDPTTKPGPEPGINPGSTPEPTTEPEPATDRVYPFGDHPPITTGPGMSSILIQLNPSSVAWHDVTADWLHSGMGGTEPMVVRLWWDENTTGQTRTTQFVITQEDGMKHSLAVTQTG